jgi:hypothetical protein
VWEGRLGGGGMVRPEVQQSLGSVSTWLCEKAGSLDYGLILVEIVVQGGKISRVDKTVKEQIRVS